MSSLPRARRGYEEMPTPNLLNQIFGRTVPKPEEVNHHAFRACRENGCVDGWLHIAAKPGENPIGHVTRCPCFERYRRDKCREAI